MNIIWNINKICKNKSIRSINVICNHKNYNFKLYIQHYNYLLPSM